LSSILEPIMRLAKPLLFAPLLIVASCARSSESADQPPFQAELLRIAAEYPAYGRVDDLARWAPELCMLPPPSRAWLSESSDATTHGSKLYFLFAKDRAAYVRTPGDSPVGQVLVKESWRPIEAAPQEAEQLAKSLRSFDAPLAEQDDAGRYLPFAEHDGRWYRTGDRNGLFIMFKADPATPGTDDGWVYGTVSADGKRVLSAGRIESCMKCHLDAPHDRVFGMPSLHR
jgi:hypothetical protein